ncbi:unnamed protein product [Rotaria sp. Silwood1]|nr:unnamed protein product [Rotaria sp. Silwood1]
MTHPIRPIIANIDPATGQVSGQQQIQRYIYRLHVPYIVLNNYYYSLRISNQQQQLQQVQDETVQLVMKHMLSHFQNN